MDKRRSHIFSTVAASILLCGALFDGLAQADTIDFTQFGAEFSSVSSGSSGTTAGAVGFTIYSADGGNFTRLNEGSAWTGIFPAGAPLLFGGFIPGAIEILFSTPITSLTLAAQPNDAGAFTETLQAFNSSFLSVDSQSANGNAQTSGPEGSIPNLTVSGLDIIRVLISTTHDTQGIAIAGGEGVGGPSLVAPLPGTLPLLLSGLGGLALFTRSKKRKARAS